jgi:hypothetical protein
VTDPARRALLVDAGRKNRTRFGWDRMARETLAVYRSASTTR